jgi:hypothetical protein
VSGAKVVIAIFGAVLAIAVLAVAGFLLTEDDKLLCAEGELQDNQVDAAGNFIPRTETFATIEEAEAFVCKHIPRPRETGDLSLNDISVTRTSNLGGLIEGTGGFTLDLTYQDGSGDLLFEAFSPPFLAPENEEDFEPIRIGDDAGQLIQAGTDTTITWERELFAYRATAALTDDFSLDDLIAILESVR